MTVAVFMSNFGFAAVIFLLILAVIFLVNSFQKKTLNVLSRLSASYNDIETLLVRYTNSIDLMNTQLKGLESQISKIEETQEWLQRELTRLADSTSAQGQLSQAIELASFEGNDLVSRKEIAAVQRIRLQDYKLRREAGR